MTAAFIVWNEDKTEGVIFIDPDEPQDPNLHNAGQDAYYAANVWDRQAALTTSLAELAREHFEDEVCTIVKTTAEVLRSL